MGIKNHPRLKRERDRERERERERESRLKRKGVREREASLYATTGCGKWWSLRQL